MRAPAFMNRYRSTVVALVLGAACGGGGDGGGPTGTGSGVNLRIETLYLVQSTQTRDGAVPLVANKDAYVRVFVVASGDNTLAPAVRVRLSQNGTVQQTFTIPAPASSVPTSVDQSSFNKSWNVKIPGSMIQPGLQILADVDPTNQVSESNEQDNSFPTSGTPQTLQVSALQTFRLRFIPMVQEENGRKGSITASNIDSYLTFTRKIHPVSSIDADLREPYTVRGLGFDPQGNTWQAAVAELDAVRVAEGSNRFYYGVVNTDYNGGGVVGIAAGIPAGAALGWDRFPDAPVTVAHEIGHDWGRRHAPCGGAGGPDPNYPYPLGMIGVYGLDVETQEVKIPSANTDIMGYCDARFWISDYNFSAIFSYRVSHPSAATAPAVPALVVWGRIDNGVPVLEPAFEATTVASLPETMGPYVVEARDDAGRMIFSVPFAAEPMPDVAGDVRHFAFAVPLSIDQSAKIATLRLVARGKEAIIRAPSGSLVLGANGVRQPTMSASAMKVSPTRASVRWDASAYPLVIVRDAVTGSILSLARGGTANVATSEGHGVELVVSDGIHSLANRTSLNFANKGQR